MKNSFPKFRNGNRRLLFLGMVGNRNGNGKTIFPQKSAGAMEKDAKFFSLDDSLSHLPLRNKGSL